RRGGFEWRPPDRSGVHRRDDIEGGREHVCPPALKKRKASASGSVSVDTPTPFEPCTPPLTAFMFFSPSRGTTDRAQPHRPPPCCQLPQVIHLVRRHQKHD